MSVNISAKGVSTRLDRTPEPPAPVTEKEVQDVSWMARTILALLRSVGLLTSQWQPRRIDFEDVVVDSSGAQKFRFEHRFGGRVRYWPVDWQGTLPPVLRKHADTDDSTLVLTSGTVGIVTIRVEEGG